METDFYDVIVVGGGPAGSSAAYFLSRGGKRVLLLEKERLPRYKTCGGGLSVRFLREQFPFSFDPILKTEINAISYVFFGQMVTIPVRRQDIGMVMRAELDTYLLERCGARVLQGAAVSRVEELDDRVVVETEDGRRFSAGYLIGADGANSRVARSAGLRVRRVLVAAIEAEVRVAPELMQRFGQQPVFIFGEIDNGYLWIFPKADHLSVGVGAYHPKPGQLQATLLKVMRRYGISLTAAEMKGHPIPVYTRRERLNTRRVLLVGDAAGLVDPLSGEGIRFAIKSGRLAAEAILKGHPARYSRDLYWSIGLNHQVTLLLSQIFYLFPLFFVFLGAPNPFTTQGVLEMLSDHRTALEFILNSALTLPVFSVTELLALLLESLGHCQAAFKLRARIYPETVSAPR